MNKFLISFLLIALFVLPLQSQNSSQNDDITRTLSYQELLDEMVNTKDSIYELNNATIKFEQEKDQRFIKDEDSLARAQLDTIYVNAKVLLNNIKFERNNNGRLQPVFLKVKFDKEVSIIDTKVDGIIAFFDCTFNSTLKIYIHQESLDNSIILHHSILKSYSDFRLTKGRLEFSKCLFDPVNKQELGDNIFYTNHIESRIFFSNNKFIKRDSTGQNVIVGRLYTLRFWDNIFETDLWFAEMSIDDITMIGNKFSGLINMTNVEFGSYKSELYYEQLRGNIGVYSNEDNATQTWRPESYKSFSDSIAAERFFNVYRRVTDHFRSRGNQKDYNKMFIEMKDFETMQLKYFYEEEKTVQNWFSWRMNQFLGRFSNYGTSPVKAVLYAIQVILFFSLFFFFFQNTWDTFTKEQLMSRIRLLTKYFRSEEGIANLYEEQERHRYKSYEDFMAYMKEGQSEIPKMFLWISKPLYKLSTIGITSTNRFLSKAELLNGKWTELDKGKKATAAFWGGLILVSHLLVSLLMKVLNAVMLSVNSFTTLGFGEIPTRGIGRYAAIIEGFMGWFLLTLFSVSLITQLLQ